MVYLVILRIFGEKKFLLLLVHVLLLLLVVLIILVHLVILATGESTTNLVTYNDKTCVSNPLVC